MTTNRWLISVPVWGERYVRVFEDMAAPALLAAVDRLMEPVEFIIHTDAPDRIRKILSGHSVDIREVGNKPTYEALQNAHADAVRSASAGDRVVLLNADLVVSANLLVSCAAHFYEGKQAVVLLGIRTAEGPERPPVGAEPRALLEWAWAHRHQIIRDLEWPHGTSMLPTNLFFATGSSVVARGFHLHPVAIIKHDAIQFHSTIDGDLLDYFPREAIHVVTSPDDCSMLEVSPPERRFPVRHNDGGLRPSRVAASMTSRASPTHKWLVTHAIGVVGPARDCGDAAVVEDILQIMTEPTQQQYNHHRGRRVRLGYDPANRAAELEAARAYGSPIGPPGSSGVYVERPSHRTKGIVPAGPRGQPR